MTGCLVCWMCFVGIKPTIDVKSMGVQHTQLVKIVIGFLTLSLSVLLSSCAGTPEGKRSHFFYPPFAGKTADTIFNKF